MACPLRFSLVLLLCLLRQHQALVLFRDDPGGTNVNSSRVSAVPAEEDSSVAQVALAPGNSSVQIADSAPAQPFDDALVQMKTLRFGVEHAVATAQQCDAYIRNHGCGWASELRCPTAEPVNGTVTMATNDGSLGYRCCCDVGLHDPALAAKGAAVALQEKADHCSALAPEQPELYKCEFTGQYPCRDQFRKKGFIQDAGGRQVGDRYTCCCVLGYWRLGLDASLGDFQKGLQAEAKRRTELMFVHIPKNAGTAIENVSSRKGIMYPKRWDNYSHGVHMPDGSMCGKWHVPPQYYRALNEDGENDFLDRDTFCVTRHPYDRVVSEYMYMLSVKWGSFMSSQYRTGIAKYPMCSAEGLNHFVHQAVTKVKEGRKFLHDCHFLPQTEFIFGRDGTLWCQNQLRFDTLPDSFNDLMEKHGAEVRLGGERINDARTICEGNITVSNLTRKTKDLLLEVYERDFNLLNYSDY